MICPVCLSDGLGEANPVLLTLRKKLGDEPTSLLRARAGIFDVMTRPGPADVPMGRWIAHESIFNAVAWKTPPWSEFQCSRRKPSATRRASARVLCGP